MAQLGKCLCGADFPKHSQKQKGGLQLGNGSGSEKNDGLDKATLATLSKLATTAKGEKAAAARTFLEALGETPKRQQQTDGVTSAQTRVNKAEQAYAKLKAAKVRLMVQMEETEEKMEEAALELAKAEKARSDECLRYANPADLTIRQPAQNSAIDLSKLMAGDFTLGLSDDLKKIAEQLAGDDQQEVLRRGNELLIGMKTEAVKLFGPLEEMLKKQREQLEQKVAEVRTKRRRTDTGEQPTGQQPQTAAATEPTGGAAAIPVPTESVKDEVIELETSGVQQEKAAELRLTQKKEAAEKEARDQLQRARKAAGAPDPAQQG